MAGVVAAMSVSRAASAGSDRSNGSHNFNSQRVVVTEDSVQSALRRADSRRRSNSVSRLSNDSDAVRLAAAVKLQENFRARCLYKQRLHRDNLSQRLLFEWRVFYGAIRLINQIMVFALLLIAVRQSGDSGTKRGIYHNLRNHFEFDVLKEVSQRSELRNTLVDLSARSKDFFVLSSQYFQPSVMGGSVELVGPMEAFNSAKVIGGVQLSIQVPEFSFTCWLRTVRQFKRGYIIRKRIVPAGTGADLACWGWHVTDVGGASLHFGAHDFYSTGAISGSAQKQHVIGLSDPHPLEPDVNHLLTVVVRGLSVTFWQNLDLLGSVELPRPITDCFNNQEGVLVGDASMSVSQLRFYPAAMTKSSIQEIYEGGSFLSDISTGSVPTTPTESPLDVMGRAVLSAVVTVGQSVADQQPRSAVDLVLQSADSALSQQAQPSVSPAAAQGKTPIDESLRMDAATGRNYTLLFEGPAKLTKSTVGNERYFDGQEFPDWSGQGVTFTMWYRRPPCSASSCGVYLLSAHHEGPQSSSRCWSVWIEDIGVYFDNMDSEAGYHYATDIMEPKFHLTDRSWRHLAYVFDETTDMWLFYQDGALAYSVPYGSSVKESHCPSSDLRIAFGARYPGWSYGLEYELHDMRAYVGLPLSSADIHAIAIGRTDALGKLAIPRVAGESDDEWADRTDTLRHQFRCTPLDSDVMMDTPWQDLYGHGCRWYHDTKLNFPGVCELPDAQSECPIACKSLEECFSSFQPPEPLFAWDSIRRIEARGESGTVCLGSEVDAPELVRQCKRWRAAENWREGIETWERDMAQKLGRRVNMTDCDELERSIDTACTFDQDRVDEFTRKVRQNGGDYTIAFWIKPLNEDALYPSGRFLPHVQLVNTFNPPRHNLGWGHYGDGQNGAARMNTACPREGVFVEAVEIDSVSESEWTFLSFTRINTTWDTLAGSQGETATNLNYWHETAGSFTQCLFDQDHFFQGIEINYPALISPVMLVPDKIPFALVQEMYYERWGSLQIQDGPLMTNAERKDTTIAVEKMDYASRSALMAAPIIFTTRTQPSSACPFEYSTQWLQEQQQAVKQTQCAQPFECEHEAVDVVSVTMACSGPPQDSDPFFGLDPVNFRGWGFADILFSITDSPFVFRDGQLRDTNSFVDSQTQSVDVIMVFFSPQYGITTVMEVQMDLGGPTDLVVDVTIRHYSIVEGSQLSSYVIVQCLVLVCVMFMVIDVVVEARDLWKRREHPLTNVKMEVIKLATDLVTAVFVTAFVVLRLPQVIATSGETKRILGQLNGIPWSNNEISMDVKKESFFRSIDDLLARIEEVENVDAFLNVILIISLLRIIQCTSLHPRLALLTGTVAKALDDFWHAALLILLMMASFAFIGTWRFGDSMDEFGTFERSMQTEFELMFGEFIDGWHENVDLQAFVVLYYMVMFMLVLNFLLAIIVEAYMGVRKEVEMLDVEQEFLTDLWDTFRAIITAQVMGWPSTKDVGTILGGARAKLSVGFLDLQQMKLFDDQHKIGSFLKFYSRFDFLEPPEITKSGRVHQKHREEGMDERIVRMVCEALDVKPRRLRDIANTSPRAASHRDDRPEPVALLSKRTPQSQHRNLQQPDAPLESPTTPGQRSHAPISASEVIHRMRRWSAPSMELPAVHEESLSNGESSPIRPTPRSPSGHANGVGASCLTHGDEKASERQALTISQAVAATVSPAGTVKAHAANGETTPRTMNVSTDPTTPPPPTPLDEPSTPPPDDEALAGTPPLEGTPVEGTPPDDEDGMGGVYVPVAHISPSTTAEAVYIEL